MRFTWWTYYVALRRAHRREYLAFSDHYSALRGDHAWRKAMRFTNRLEARRAER